MDRPREGPLKGARIRLHSIRTNVRPPLSSLLAVLRHVGWVRGAVVAVADGAKQKKINNGNWYGSKRINGMARSVTPFPAGSVIIKQ